MDNTGTMHRPSAPSTSGTSLTPPDVPRIAQVVVPLDLDDGHHAAARWASSVADRLGVATRFLVANRYESSERPEFRRELEELGTVDEARSWFRAIGVQPGDVEMVAGDLNDSVETTADEGTIVVIGSDDQEGVTPLALGAAARDLATRLDCPVVTVPTPPGGSTAADGMAGGGPIVVGTSGRSGDEIRSLAWAAALGEAIGRDVVAVHAVDPSLATPDQSDDFDDDDRRAREMAHRVGATYRRELGDPVEVCRDLVDDLDAAFLVVSAKHRRSLGGRLLGRVADSFIHEPPVPVAIVTYEYTNA